MIKPIKTERGQYIYVIISFYLKKKVILVKNWLKTRFRPFDSKRSL